MASSRLIAAGETYTPDDINNLRADVLDPVGGHKHNGTDGARVPFSNLDVTGTAGSVAPPSGSKSYNEIATHVASSQGQHGMIASVHAVGSPTSSAVIVAGSGTLSGEFISVSFGFTFAAIPHVVACYTASPAASSSYVDAIWVDNITPSGCLVHTSSNSWFSKPFSWIAVGIGAA